MMKVIERYDRLVFESKFSRRCKRSIALFALFDALCLCKKCIKGWVAIMPKIQRTGTALLIRRSQQCLQDDVHRFTRGPTVPRGVFAGGAFGVEHRKR